jgi:glycine cleavage system H protein
LSSLTAATLVSHAIISKHIVLNRINLHSQATHSSRPSLTCPAPTAKIGITEYAAHSLGDVVFVELPEAELEVGAGEPVGAVESVKSASDVLSPVAGKVIRGNEILEDNAKTINASPEGEGWIAEIEVADAAELDALLDEAAYKATIDA